MTGVPEETHTTQTAATRQDRPVGATLEVRDGLLVVVVEGERFVLRVISELEPCLWSEREEGAA